MHLCIVDLLAEILQAIEIKRQLLEKHSGIKLLLLLLGLFTVAIFRPFSVFIFLPFFKNELKNDHF